MDLATLLSFEWGIMMPEFIILGVATVITLLDLFMPKGQNRKILGWIGFMGILAAIVSLSGLLGHDVTSILYDTFRLDSFAKAFKLILLVGAALVMLLAIGYEPKEGLTEHRSEFFYLFLTALLGAMKEKYWIQRGRVEIRRERQYFNGNCLIWDELCVRFNGYNQYSGYA
jgi:NADH-quinone oxidoreductase subunit N